MIGRKLSHYEVIDEISRGGMGVVYRARDLTLGREVALKVLPEDLVNDPERRARLMQEARTASALEHPHIAVIHAVGEAEGVTFIAMELIRGEKLSDTIARGSLSHKRALDLATEVAEGLARAHDKGLVHRDLKPANVMVTDDGHAKVIDFGLAKLIEPAASDDVTATAHAGETGPGVILGTASYMSPEQARGVKVDHRSDVFSFGVMLYEMLTGRVPFHGQSQLDTLHAIISQPMPPLPTLSGLPDEAAADVQRVIAKCTAKDPDDRYQGMRDIVVDLRAARRKMESASGSVVMPAATRAPAGSERSATRSMGVVAIAAVAAAFLLVGTMWFWRPWEPSSQPAGSVGGKPAVAVLYFENQTGDPELDWMRTGLADMVVTDLSQSPDIEVLGTDRVYQILDELNRADDKIISAEVVQQVAERARVDRVLVGSFVKAGDTIRINARLQEADTGKIVTAERVEGAGESGIFSLVDELTRRIKSQMALLARASRPSGLLERPGDAPEVGLDRGVTEITTSSIEAYRHYAEAINLHERFLENQAIPLLEKAVEIDPTFAMALVKLAVISGNLGLPNRDAYAKRAFDSRDRLTSRERSYIEGYYYSLRPETLEQGIAAYRRGLAEHPEHQASRHNLAVQYTDLERYEEARAEYEELIRRGTSNPTSHSQLAELHALAGDTASARGVLERFLQLHPENAAAHRGLAEVLVIERRLAEAQAAFDKSLALDPRDFQAKLGLFTIFLMEDRLQDATRVRQQLGESPSPFERLLSAYLGTAHYSRLGQAEPLVAELEPAMRLTTLPVVQRALLIRRQASLLAALGRVAAALSITEAMQVEAVGSAAEFDAVAAFAIAQAKAGQASAARETSTRLDELAKTAPSPERVRTTDIVRGLVARASGDTSLAIDALTRAARGLRQHGPLTTPSLHVTLWFEVATANREAGREAEAAEWLERIVNVGHERVFDMLSYIRAHFLLAEIYDSRGDAARARPLYERFVSYWGDGDIDQDSVAAARRKLVQ
jgi:TolB-like protein/tetratricopeptide (TPR) repeat protein/predicted Ser/Thr protein kinase